MSTLPAILTTMSTMSTKNCQECNASASLRTNFEMLVFFLFGIDGTPQTFTDRKLKNEKMAIAGIWELSRCIHAHRHLACEELSSMWIPHGPYLQKALELAHTFLGMEGELFSVLAVYLLYFVRVRTVGGKIAQVFQSIAGIQKSCRRKRQISGMWR